MKLHTNQTTRARFRRASNLLMRTALIAGFSVAISSKATVPTSDLPDFDNLPNFAQLGNDLNENDGDVYGNVGVSEGGTISIGAPSTINGDLYLATGATQSGPGAVTGTTFTGVSLSTEQSTVFTASADLANLTPDQVVSGDQTTGLSIDVAPGEVYVLNLNGGLDLNNQNITLTGGGDLVLNIGNTFSLTGSASIDGPAQNIFVNYTGGNTVDTHVGDTVNGQVFIPNAPASLDGVWNGGVFSGNLEASLLSAGTINAVPVPEPGVMALISASLVASLLLVRRRLDGMKRSV